MTSFADRVVLITGAGSGIGRQLCHVLAAEGARIAAVDRNPDSLAALEKELAGKRVAVADADVTNLIAVREAARKLEALLGPTDILIANAGIGVRTPAEDFRAEDIAAQINVNLIGVANSIDAVLPGMRQRKSGQLVALSSLASFRGMPHMAAYCASKAGVNALLDALRVELCPYNIAVTTICPGFIRTPLTTAIDVPPERMMELDYAVKKIVGAIRARKAFLAFPRKLAWQLRLMRWLPCGISDWMIRRQFQRLTKQ